MTILYLLYNNSVFDFIAEPVKSIQILNADILIMPKMSQNQISWGSCF